MQLGDMDTPFEQVKMGLGKVSSIFSVLCLNLSTFEFMDAYRFLDFV